MRYTLTIEDTTGAIVVNLSYTMWSQVCEAAKLLELGVAYSFQYRIRIEDNEKQEYVFNEVTY
jgi:hypothetical protein